MEKLVQIGNKLREWAGRYFTEDKEHRPMTAKEKWLIFLLAGLLLMLLFWPGSKSERTDDSSTGIFQSLTGKEASDSGESSDSTEGAAQTAQGYSVVTGNEEDYAEYLSKKLTAYLSQMAGAGEVEAWVTLKSGEQEVLYEEKSSQSTSLSEADSQGGTREETTEDVTRTVIYGADGNPYVVQTTLPEVQGVLVMAEGGDDSSVRLDIVEAVQVLFDLDAHKIKVVKKKVEE